MESSIHERTKQSQKQTGDRKKKKLNKKKTNHKLVYYGTSLGKWHFVWSRRKRMVQIMCSIRTGNLIHSQALPFKLLH